MKGDLDKRWPGSGSSSPSNEEALTVEAQRAHRYQRLLRKSKVENMSEIANTRCLYISGADRLGRPVVVFVGKRFNASLANFERVMMYIISVLDTIVEKDYVVVYFHTLTAKEDLPSFQFVQSVYDTLEYKYKKNLKALYVVHPSFWCRILTWWFTTFTASAIRDKVYCLGGVEYLQHIIPLSHLQVPSFIMDYDYKVNFRISINSHSG